MKRSVFVSDSQPQTQRLCEAGRRSHLHAGLLWSFRMAGAFFSQSTVCLRTAHWELCMVTCVTGLKKFSGISETVFNYPSSRNLTQSTAAWISHRRVLFLYEEHKANTQDLLYWGYSYCITCWSFMSLNSKSSLKSNSVQWNS